MFTNAQDALRFINAGKARFTLTSKKTGTSFTFKADAPKDDDSIRFVKVLNGPDNSRSGDWMFLGFLRADTEGSIMPHLMAGRMGL
jgi:hypothetical protein